MKNNLLFLFVVLNLFSGCKKELPKKTENPKFVRTWYDTVQGMPYRAKLIIKTNKTFEFSSHSCQSGAESKGKWTIEKDTIILNSIKPKNCLFQHPFGIICNFDEIVKNNKTIKDCEPSGRESDYVIFEDEKFYIKNDTLIHENKKDVTCTKLKIAFSTKEKVRKIYNK
jgi:hypothetical protein